MSIIRYVVYQYKNFIVSYGSYGVQPTAAVIKSESACSNERDSFYFFLLQSRIDPPGRHILILLYAFMIILGSVGNLGCYSVLL